VGIRRPAVGGAPARGRSPARAAPPIPDRAEAPSYAAGWQLCLQSLGELLGNGATRSRVGTSAPAYGWQELHDKYGRYLGIDV
jgi:hypothetical protein